MSKNTIHIPLLSLLLLAGYASFGAVLPTPALPAIAQYFHVTVSQTEAIMFIYLIGYALGQLIFGPISNRFGRKLPLTIGIAISLLGNLIGAAAPFLHVFELLVIARFITAIGAAASLVIGMILIKDCYDEVNARRTFSKIVLTFAFVPFIASSLGGALTHYLGWQILNAVLIFYAVILLFLISFLPETMPKENRLSLSFNYLLTSYKKLLRNSEYLRLIFLFSLGSATSYVFNALAPIVAIKTMHLTAEFYGYLSIVPSIGILIGGLASTRLAHQVKASIMIIVGVSLIAAGSLGLGVLFEIGSVNLIALYTMAIILFIGHALVIPNAGMQAQSQIADHANGTSVMNASALLFSSVLVSLGGGFIDVVPVLALPITLFFIGLSGIILVILPQFNRVLFQASDTI